MKAITVEDLRRAFVNGAIWHHSRESVSKLTITEEIFIINAAETRYPERKEEGHGKAESD